jgi:hypothetical protein
MVMQIARFYETGLIAAFHIETILLIDLKKNPT